MTTNKEDIITITIRRNRPLIKYTECYISSIHNFLECLDINQLKLTD